MSDRASPPNPDQPSPPESGILLPWRIIQEAAKVPGARFLLVVAGLIACAALLAALFAGDLKLALIVIAVVFVLCVLVILLMGVPGVTKTKGFQWAVYTVIWAVVVACVLLLTCTLWRWPRDIKEIFSFGPATVSPVESTEPVIRIDWALDSSAIGDRAFVILSILDYIQLEPVAETSDVACHRRITYTVLPLKDVMLSDTDTFTEIFPAFFGDGLPPQHWYGSDLELLEDEKRPDGRKYKVTFEAHKNVPQTITTGCNTVHHSVAGTIPPYGWHEPLKAGQDFFQYDNKTDYIRSYEVIIDSSAFDLALINAVGERGPNQTLKPIQTNSNSGKPAGQHCVSARWENLVPGDVVGILFQYKGMGESK